MTLLAIWLVSATVVGAYFLGHHVVRSRESEHEPDPPPAPAPRHRLSTRIESPAALADADTTQRLLRQPLSGARPIWPEDD